MTGVGAKLRQAREARGRTVEEIAEETKIGLHQLEALERGDLSALPDPVFLRGFIRSYADAVGLDGEALVAEIAPPEPGADLVAAMADRLGVRPARRGLPLGITAGALAAVALIAAGAVWLFTPSGEPPAAPAVGAAPRPVTPAAREPPVETERRPEPPPERETPVEVAPATEPRPEPARERSTMRVEDSGVGTAVVDRALVGRGERFTEGREVWFWTRVVGGEAGSSIEHVWLHDGIEVGRARLPIGGAHWRTQSRRALPAGSAGSWRVEARDASGRLLAQAAFVCEPG